MKKFKVLYKVILYSSLVKVFDVFKTLLISAKIGISGSADIFIAISAIPDNLLILLGIDPIRGVVNSEYSSTLIKDKNLVKKSFENLIKIFFIISISLMTLTFVFNSIIVNVFLPGFDHSEFILATSISLIIFPTIFFKSFATLMVPYYNANQKFNFPLILQLTITFSIIASIFVPEINNNIIYNLAYGFLIGNFFYFIILIFPIIKSINLLNFFKIKLDPLTIRIFKSVSIMFIVTLLNQIYLSSRFFFASFFEEGSISAINYSTTLIIFISAFTSYLIFSVLLNKFSVSFLIDYRIKTKKLFTNSIYILLILFIPIIILFLIFPKDILSFVFLRQNFNEEGISKIIIPFFWESLSLLNYIFQTICVALLLSKKEYKLLTIYGVISYSIGILFNFLFSNYYGYYGVSIANFFTTLIYSFILMFNVRLFLGKMKTEIIQFFKIVFCGIVGLFFLYLLKNYFSINLYFLNNTFESFIFILLALIVITITFFILLSIFKVHFFIMAFKFIKQKYVKI
ncbi:MAG TPA: lipid II flippase MurJ [Ignavibacteria bacterium]|nr:lipid II flippase MurJ [Ignavibacteria bacterium]